MLEPITELDPAQFARCLTVGDIDAFFASYGVVLFVLLGYAVCRAALDVTGVLAWLVYTCLVPLVEWWWPGVKQLGQPRRRTP